VTLLAGGSETPGTARSAGPVALVTGAGGGLGRALVAALAGAGWTVAGATRRDGELAFDLADRAAAGMLVGRVLAGHGRLDLLVANHATMSLAPVDRHPIDDWWRIVDVNLGGSFRLARAAAGALRRSAGSIVFVASEWGLSGWPEATAYAASKAALVGLTKALALELAPSVRVNAVAPGVIDTPQLAVDASAVGASVEEIKRRYAERIPLRRIASPAEIAASVVFLGSREAAFYTGQVLSPNGGTTMTP